MTKTQIKVNKLHDYLSTMLDKDDYATVCELIDLEIELEAECNM